MSAIIESRSNCTPVCDVNLNDNSSHHNFILHHRSGMLDELQKKLSKSKLLYLPLTKEWFDMINSGEKKEEYRNITPYWLVRFLECKGVADTVKYLMCQAMREDFNCFRHAFNTQICKNITYDYIIFKNGYSNQSPTLIVECLDIKIRTGKPEWGASCGELYFTLKLGEIIFRNNINNSN